VLKAFHPRYAENKADGMYSRLIGRKVLGKKYLFTNKDAYLVSIVK